MTNMTKIVMSILIGLLLFLLIKSCMDDDKKSKYEIENKRLYDSIKIIENRIDSLKTAYKIQNEYSNILDSIVKANIALIPKQVNTIIVKYEQVMNEDDTTTLSTLRKNLSDFKLLDNSYINNYINNHK